MKMPSTVVRLLLVLVLVIFLAESISCYRSRPSRPSSPSRPSRPSPTYRPFPQHPATYRPSPTRAPTYRPFPSPTHRPFPTHGPTYRPVPTPSPTYRPVPTRSPTYRPFPAQPTYRPFPAQPTYRPNPSYPNSGSRYPTQPQRYPTQPQRYPTQPVGSATRAPTRRTTHRGTTTRAPIHHTTYRTQKTTSGRRTTSRTPTHTTESYTTKHATIRTTSARRTTSRIPSYTTERHSTKRTTVRTTSAMHSTTLNPTFLTTRYTTGRTAVTAHPTISMRRTTHLPITTMPTNTLTTRRITYISFTTIPTSRQTTWRTTRNPITTIPTIRQTTSRTTRIPITTMSTTRFTTQRRKTKVPLTTIPTRYTTQGPHPSYPGFTGGGGYRQYQPSYSVPIRVPSSGGTKVKVYNINNYRPSSYWAPPSYPTYHYTYRDTGSTALGFYLGYNLGHLSHPTYYHHSHTFYDGYSPRYDHYTVHHYYHNSASVPKEQTVTTKVIIQCGDGSKICPANTTALCTANGQIMCVVVASNTVPCRDNANLRCVKSMVPCENNEAPECKGVAKGQLTSIDIPCISNTVIEGNVTTVNNTIVSTDPKNTTTGFIANSTVTQATTLPTIITTLPNTTFPSLGVSRKRREVPQYCVTVLAEPQLRVPTEGEQVFKEVSSVFDKFFVKAFGLDKVNTKPTVPDLGN